MEWEWKNRRRRSIVDFDEWHRNKGLEEESEQEEGWESINIRRSILPEEKDEKDYRTL